MNETRAPPASAPARPRALSPGEVAWIAVVPCAVVVLAAIVVAGPVLGHALLSPGSEALWPPNTPNTVGKPEPVKHARYLISLLGPVLLAAAIFLGRQVRQPVVSPATRRTLVVATQVSVLLFVVAAVLGHYNLLLAPNPPRARIFPPLILVVAAVLPVALIAAMRRPRVAHAVGRLVPDTRARRVACVAVAALFTVLWLLLAVDNEGSIGHEPLGDLLTWTMDDPFAVLNGRTPLVDFRPLYSQLWPYLSAGWMSLAGTTVTAFTLLMTAASGLALAAVYAVFRRVTRSSTLALALYVPFVATGFLSVFRVFNNVEIFSMWPLRYGGVYLMAWLTARHLDGATPRRPWPIMLVGGLLVIDNLEFGVAALVATLVALACAPQRRSLGAVARLAAGAAAGLLAAALIVSAGTLARSGTLPRFVLETEFPRIYGVLGLVSLPMPTLGIHLVLYATFVAAIAVAVVRLLAGRDEPLLTGMLAWSGVFGLLGGSYYVGHAENLKLVAIFSAWAFALALLTVVTVRGLAARSWRRPSLAELMVLAGFGASVCAIAGLPKPWAQVARLRAQTPVPVLKQPAALRFVAAHTAPGEKVAILMRLGHRIAYDLGITDVSPYPLLALIVTRRQLQIVLDAARREGAHAIFVEDQLTAPAQLGALASAGFSRRASSEGFAMWSDAGRP